MKKMKRDENDENDANFVDFFSLPFFYWSILLGLDEKEVKMKMMKREEK